MFSSTDITLHNELENKKWILVIHRIGIKTCKDPCILFGIRKHFMCIFFVFYIQHFQVYRYLEMQTCIYTGLLFHFFLRTELTYRKKGMHECTCVSVCFCLCMSVLCSCMSVLCSCMSVLLFMHVCALFMHVCAFVRACLCMCECFFCFLFIQNNKLQVQIQLQTWID